MAGSFYLYGEALLANWWLIVTGGAPLALDGLAQIVSSRWRTWAETRGPWRRRLEIGFLLGAIVWAGFLAWRDEHGRAQGIEVQRQSAQQWLYTWKVRADERWRAIHDPGGYIDQINKLKNQPPKVQRVPGPTVQVPVVIPSGGQVLSLEQLTKVQNIRIALGNLLAEGNALKNQAATPSAPDPLEKANSWAATVEDYLKANLDASYVQRFRDSSDIAPRILGGVPPPRENEWWGIYTRTVRLNQFITELSK